MSSVGALSSPIYFHLGGYLYPFWVSEINYFLVGITVGKLK
jgi:hypothetical protein